MKLFLKRGLAISVCVLLGGCASPVVPMGANTFMVEHGGWPHMNQFALEAKCVRDANRYCERRGLVMVPVSTSGQEGQAFSHNATCKFIFRAVPMKQPDSGIESRKNP